MATYSCPASVSQCHLGWSIRDAVLNDPTRSRGSPPHGVTPADSSASVGSDRSVSAGRVVTGNSRRSFLVARPRSLRARRFSGAGVPSARVMVRRLGRGLRGSLSRAGRFRPLAPEDVERSINARELLAIERALKWFAPLLAGSSVVVFADNSTAVSYLRNQGGTRSSFLNSIAQRILRWAEDLSVVISPQVYYGETQCPGGRSFSAKPDLGLRVDADAGGLRGSVQEVAGFDRPVCNISDHRCSLYFSPYHDHNALGTDVLLQNWNGWQAYAFRASPALKRVEKLFSLGDVFLSCVSQPVSSWLEY